MALRRELGLVVHLPSLNSPPTEPRQLRSRFARLGPALVAAQARKKAVPAFSATRAKARERPPLQDSHRTLLPHAWLPRVRRRRRCFQGVAQAQALPVVPQRWARRVSRCAGRFFVREVLPVRAASTAGCSRDRSGSTNVHLA